MNHKENLVGVLQTLLKWRRAILAICALAFAASVATTLLMPNYYKATTVFYAASPDLFKPEQLFGGSSKDMEYYGSGNDIDRILTIAKSKELLDFIVRKFDLYRHYGIDSTNQKASFRISTRFFKHYDVQKTKHDAIELSMEDTDRELAAQIANAARDKVDEIAQQLVKQSQARMLKSYEQSINEKQQLLGVLGDSLMRMRKLYGIYDLRSGSMLAELVAEAEANFTRNKAKLSVLEKTEGIRRDTIALIRASVKGYEEELRNLTSDSSLGYFNLKRYNDGISRIEVVTQMHGATRDQISRDINRYDQVKSAYESHISAVHLIESASVPVVKSRPKRTVIVLASVLAGLFFSMAGVLLIENYGDIPALLRQQRYNQV